LPLCPFAVLTKFHGINYFFSPNAKFGVVASRAAAETM
jgi:hypothetical protein